MWECFLFVDRFFQGWKRKIGGVTLVLACLFAGVWVRGFAIDDVVRLGGGQRVVTTGRVLQTLSTCSRNGFLWTREETDANITWLAGWQSLPSAESRAFDPTENGFDTGTMDWRYQFLGLDFGRFHGDPGDTISYWRISHGSIVIPLLLVSAFLLLSKPRPTPL